jgi:hypothetical protein
MTGRRQTGGGPRPPRLVIGRPDTAAAGDPVSHGFRLHGSRGGHLLGIASGTVNDYLSIIRKRLRKRRSEN